MLFRRSKFLIILHELFTLRAKRVNTGCLVSLTLVSLTSYFRQKHSYQYNFISIE